MKKIVSIIALCLVAVSYAAAQATLPFAEFTSESFNDVSIISDKDKAIWDSADEGRSNIELNGSFVFRFNGSPGVLRLQAKSSSTTSWFITYYNAKLRVQVSPDGSEWETIENSLDLNGSYRSVAYDIPTNTQYVRIYNSGSSTKGNTLFVRGLSLTDYEFAASAESLVFPDTEAVTEGSQLSVMVKAKGINSAPKVALRGGTSFSVDVNELPIDQVTNPEGEGAVVNVSFVPLEMGTFKDTLLVMVGVKDTLFIPLEGISTTISRYEMYASAEKLTFPDIKAITETHTLQVAIKGQGMLSNPLVMLQGGTVFTTTTTELSLDEVYDVEGEGAVIDILFSPMELGTFTDTLLVMYGTTDTVRVALEGVSSAYQAELIPTVEFTPFESSYLTPSVAQTLAFEVEHLISNVVIKAPTHFKVSTDGVTYADSLSMPFADLNEAVNTEIFIRMETKFVGKFTGKVSLYNKESRVPLHEYPVVGEVVKAVPTVTELPIAARELVSGETLGELLLTGGSVLNSAGDTISGEFRWVYADDYVPEIGITELPIYFVPKYSYGYETANAMASVTVLRATQVLTWEQEIDVLSVGDEITFTAEATSELDVTYTANKPELLRIEGSTARALAPGRVRVTAVQEGDTQFQPSEGIAYYITIVAPTNVEIANAATVKALCVGGELRVTANEAFKLTLFDALGGKLVSDEEATAAKVVPVSAFRQRFLIARLVFADGSSQSIKIMLVH